MSMSVMDQRRALIARFFPDGPPALWCPPLTHYTDDGQEIFAAVQSLMPPFGLPEPARQVQVTAADLRHDALQLSLLEDRVRRRRLQQAMDAVNDRFGEFSIMPATVLLDTFPLRNGPPGHGFCKRFAVDG